METEPAGAPSYSSADIQVLDCVTAAIRKRPGMYVGNPHDGSALHHLLWEVVANCIDEHLAGFCSTVRITLHADDSVTVEDDGRGISLEPDAEGVSVVERVLTRLHFAGTYDGHSKHVHLGMHGVGLVAVNALSSTLEVEIFRGGRVYRQSYQKGVAEGPLARREATERHGTRLTFAPDPAIFSARRFQHDLIADRLRELSAFNPALWLRFVDERSEFCSSLGVSALVADSIRGAAAVAGGPIAFQGEVDTIEVDIALHWAAHPEGRISSFVNQRASWEGGTHVEGFRRGLTRAFRAHAVGRRLPVARGALLSFLEHGLHAVIAIIHFDPSFDSPTVSKLASKDATRAVERVVFQRLGAHLREHPELLDALLARPGVPAPPKRAGRRATPA